MWLAVSCHDKIWGTQKVDIQKASMTKHNGLNVFFKKNNDSFEPYECFQLVPSMKKALKSLFSCMTMFCWLLALSHVDGWKQPSAKMFIPISYFAHCFKHRNR